jgi:ATP-dependent DNA helicase RecQ
MPAPAAAIELLNAVFGFPAFREGQERAVEKLLAGQSVVAIFPTGGGKSLCYQLPALLLDGLTLVISPLIALMKDQIDFLKSKGVAAARLDSSVEPDEARAVYRDLHSGRLKLLYVAPERLASERFVELLKRLRLSMLAVDEAHCISEWGHNFRPDYLKLARLAKALNVERVLALTATATPSVAKDIARAFDVADDAVVRTDFHRPNLTLYVTPVGAADRDDLLVERIRARPHGPTIVYVTLQKTAEYIADWLSAAGLPARAYHAGLKAEERNEVQDAFMASPDAIVVATIAFGMGIDKSDIRAVYHYNLPKTLENYAQEIGRAGRDGRPSVCEVLACGDDVTVLENFTYGDTPTPEAVAGLVDELLGQGERFDVSPYDLSGAHDIRPLVVDTVLTYLELDGVIESTGPFYNEYKFVPLKSSADILAKFDARRAAFLRKLLAQARKLQKWFSIDIAQTALATSEPREKVVAALNYLEEQGDLTLQVAGLRQGYRLLQPDINRTGLAQSLAERFTERESRDIGRLKQTLDYVTHEGCRTRYLLRYFGEDLDHDCGHCGWCEGVRSAAMPQSPRPDLGDRETALVRRLLAEAGPALGAPRQMTRFLCGINSPGLTRARLSRHQMFGALTGVPFKDVLEFVQTTARSERA